MYKIFLIVTGCITIMPLQAQWTNDNFTIHDGSARISDSDAAMWNSNLVDANPDNSDEGGMQFLLNSNVEALVLYNYSDEMFHLGHPFLYSINIDVNNPDISDASLGTLTLRKNSDLLTIDNNEIQSFSGNNILAINNDGGDVSIGKSDNAARIYMKEGVGIGIGITTPSTNLHMITNDNSLRIDGDHPNFAMHYDGITKANIGYTNNGTGSGLPHYLKFRNATDGDIRLFTNGSERLTVNNDSKIGIGTTLPEHELTVMGDVYVTGEVTVLSDSRLKKDISEIHDASSVISQLNPVTYEFRTDGYANLEMTDKLRWGLIAQEVEKILPALVTNMPQSQLVDGQLKSINYLDIIPFLIQSNQEMQQRINQLIEFNTEFSQEILSLEDSIKNKGKAVIEPIRAHSYNNSKY